MIAFTFIHSQNETKKWYFGLGAALDFMTNPPTNISSTTFSANYSQACVADANGNLLFYCSGATIWTKTHTAMANGGLLTQTKDVVLIVQRPGSQNLYYVFAISPSLNSNAGLYYSIVDMSLAAGQGSVTVKNVLVYSGSLCAKLTGTKHCNGTDYWIVTKGCSNTNTPIWNGICDFRAYQLGSTGLNMVPSVSTFIYNNTTYYAGSTKIGQMKISPNGKKLACANYGFVMPYNSNVGSFELYDFDNSTGLISNLARLYTSPPAGSGAGANADGWGVEFSPDASKLYGSLADNYYYPNGSIIQWDLCQGNNNQASATQTPIAFPTYTPINGFTGLQLAPNGKIYANPYMGGGTLSDVSVINFPNAYGAACGFSLAVQSVSPGLTGYYPPNFMGSQFFLSASIPAYSLSVISNSVGCQSLQFQSPLPLGTVVGNCPANTYTLQGLLWDFNDPGSGPNNTSTAINPLHVFSAFGMYTVKLTLDFGCGGGTSTLTQTLSIPNPGFGNLIHSNSLACNSINTGTATYVNQLPFNQNYLWTNGTTSYTTLFVNTLSVGTWTSIVTNTLTSCQSTTVFTIQQAPAITVTPSSPTVCLNNTLTINASGGTGSFNYLWSNGVSSSNGLCNISGVNTVTVSDANGCTKVSNFTVFTLPTILASGTTICIGSSATLHATGAANYSWSPGGLIGNDFSVSPAGTTIYAVTGLSPNGCRNTETVGIYVNPLPTLLIAASHTGICSGSSATLSGAGATTYTWSPGAASMSSITVMPNTTTLYTLSGTNAFGCTSSNGFNLVVNLIPTLLVTSSLDTLCLGNAAILTASGATNYTWMPLNQSGNNIVVSPSLTTTYSVIGESNGCKASSSILQYIIPCKPPVFGLTNAAGEPILFSSNFYKINFTVTAVNASSLNLNNILLNSDLVKTFPYPCTYSIVNSPTVRSFGSALVPNSLFDGSSQMSLTTPLTSTLLANKRDTLTFTILVEPHGFIGIVKNSVVGFGNTNTNKTVTDSSNNGFAWDPDNDGDPTNNNVATLIDIQAIDLFIPEGFSPNDDGMYDQFVISGLNGRSVKFTVFNRWGNKVFFKEGTEISWDGKVNVNAITLGNGKLPSATYYYILEFSNGSKSPITGFIVLEY